MGQPPPLGVAWSADGLRLIIKLVSGTIGASQTVSFLVQFVWLRLAQGMHSLSTAAHSCILALLCSCTISVYFTTALAPNYWYQCTTDIVTQNAFIFSYI